MPTQTIDELRGRAPRKQPYTLYAVGDRVYARNAAGPVIDLGALLREDGGFGYVLDGNSLTGRGFFTAEAALRDLARHLRFLWLDGQFTALPDVRPALDLSQAVSLDIELDELGPGERIEDARV